MSSPMRLFLILASLFPLMLQGADRQSVQVVARVPLIATVDGPAQVILAPGEVLRIRVSVAANVPWVLDVHSPNAAVSRPATLSGPAGAAASNTCEIALACSPRAAGMQAVALVYTLMPR